MKRGEEFVVELNGKRAYLIHVFAYFLKHKGLSNICLHLIEAIEQNRITYPRCHSTVSISIG